MQEASERCPLDNGVVGVQQDRLAELVVPGMVPLNGLFITTDTGTYGASIWSWVWAQSNAESAVEAALRECRELQSEDVEFQTGTADCYVHSIGNINVSGMTDEQLKKAIKLYQNNPDATNDDLIPVKK